MANTTLSLVNLDFDSLKQGFKTYLQGQDEFKSYDWDATNLNVLLDVMSYNSWINAFYLNMELAEGFLDSAQMKSSIFSKAKELNYLPRSARSASANVTLSFTGSGGSYLLQKGQTFSSVIKNKTLTFSLDDNVLLTSPNSSFSANLTILEGPYLADTYVINSRDESQRIVLTNPNADTSSLNVVVREDGDTVGKSYLFATTLLDLNSTSRVYFLQKDTDDRYRVIFGDGVIGKKPKDGSIIILDYRVSLGAGGNGAKIFSINFNPGPDQDAADIVVSTVSQSTGGSDAETTDSVRFYAPRHFEIQQRGITAPDYGILLQQQFPEIHAAAVTGGEDLNPPRYGKVVVAVDIEGVDGLPDSKVRQYEEFLSNKVGLTVGVIFTKPLRTYLGIVSRITYNINLTSTTPENMEAIAKAAILTFSDDHLDQFGAKFRYSRLGTAIDDSDTAVIGNQTDTYLYKKVSFLQEGTVQSVDIDFRVLLKEGEGTDLFPHVLEHTVWSQQFRYNGSPARFEDNGGGQLWLVQGADTTERFTKNIGTVDYDTGLLKLINFSLDSYDTPELKVYVRTRDKDVEVDPATILVIEGDEVSLTATGTRE